MSTHVTLTIEDVDAVIDQGSVVVITGTDDVGQRVTFAGDHRPLGHIIEALLTDAEDEIVVEVEDWQILGASK